MRFGFVGAVITAAAAMAPWFEQTGTNAEFIAVPIDGEPTAGRLLGLTPPWRIVLQVGDRLSMDGKDLVALRRDEVPESGPTGPYVLLANGDRIRAVAQSSSQDTLRISSELLGTLDLPLERVEGIVFGAALDTSSRARIERTLLAGQRKQDVVILANSDETAGTFTGLDNSTIRLDRPGGALAIHRTGVRAIAFSSDLIAFPKQKDFYAQMILADGSELSVTNAELGSGNLKGRAAVGIDFVLPIEQLRAFEFRNGRVQYLSDMEPLEYRHTPYLTLSYAYRRDRSVGGGPISLRGQLFRKGIGVHSRAELTYQLDEKHRRFDATVGIDDETAGQGSVNFRVLLDGRTAWQSGPVTGQSAPKRLQVDVAGAKRLTLLVDFAALGDVQDHADWADARLVQ